jgi:hypothetical protein
MVQGRRARACHSTGNMYVPAWLWAYDSKQPADAKSDRTAAGRPAEICRAIIGGDSSTSRPAGCIEDHAAHVKPRAEAERRQRQRQADIPSGPAVPIAPIRWPCAATRASTYGSRRAWRGALADGGRCGALYRPIDVPSVPDFRPIHGIEGGLTRHVRGFTSRKRDESAGRLHPPPSKHAHMHVFVLLAVPSASWMRAARWNSRMSAVPPPVLGFATWSGQLPTLPIGVTRGK